MEKLHDFNSFSQFRKNQQTAKIEEEREAKRASSAQSFKDLLSEYGVSEISELNDEDKAAFFERLKENSSSDDVSYMIDRLEEAYVEEGNAFGAARAEAIANGDSEFTVDGETYPVEDVDAEDKENAEEFAEESNEVNEAEVTSDEEFTEYAKSVLQKAFGDGFDEAKAQETIDGILSKAEGDYGAAVGMLQSSLG
jgi:hypothetical protein